MNENDIRDILANNLAILEDGLQLLDIEKFIPSTLGTRSFIDILAKDSSGHWVIIEVKKTNAAAREAAHEVFKYVESIQRHFGARNDEIRAIVVSVEWAELLVPFSRFLSETSIAIEGFRLLLGDHGEDFQALPIEPIPVNKSRYLAPWHELNLYQNKSNLERGIISYDECCRNKAITDYILVGGVRF
jgi:Endonuclease NucS